MFYNVECPNCAQTFPYDAMHAKMACPNCQTVLTLTTTQTDNERLVQQMDSAYKSFHFLKVEALADQYMHTNPMNTRVYVYKAATMMFNQIHFTNEQLTTSFEHFETAYTLSTTEQERLFVVEQMNATICALYLHHLKQSCQHRDIDSLPQVETMYNRIAALQFNDQSLRYLFLLQLAQAHDMLAKELNRHYIRYKNAYKANNERTHKDTQQYVKDILFFSLIAKFIAKRSEILNQLSAVQLDDALLVLYDLIIDRYDEEMNLSYFIAIESFNGTDYHKVQVELEPATLNKLRAYRESYTLLRTKVGLKASS